MADMLVPLHRLPEAAPPEGYTFRRPLSCESQAVREFIGTCFSRRWANEVQPALSRVPSTMFVAVDDDSGAIAGFCAWDCTALGFLGPVGTAGEHRGKGVGGTLVLHVLHSMREQGYGYAVVGDAGEPGFFAGVAGATEIPGNRPGIYPEHLL